VGALGTAALLANVSAMASNASRVYEDGNDYATTVRFDDLNLDRKAGAETLYERLGKAARRVCGARETGSVFFHNTLDWERCQADALQRAVVRIDNSHLTAIHQHHTGHQHNAGQELAALRR
jgi:UrcA family protein